MVWAGAALAATGAAVLLGTALSSVPEPLLVQATQSLVPAVLSFGQTVVKGVFVSEGQEIPLPPGDWVVMRNVVTPSGPRISGTTSVVSSTVLLRLSAHHVDAALLVQANPLDSPSNWGLAPGCRNPEFYHAFVRYSSDHDSACSYVTYVGPWATGAPPVDEAWRLSMQDTVDNGWSVPTHWLEVVYRLTDAVNALQVRYLFDPTPGAAKGGQVTSEQVSRLVAWSDSSWWMIQLGSHDRLNTKGADGLVDPALIRASGARLIPTPPPMTRAELKTMTAQMIGSVASFTVAYVYLGSLAAASTLSVAASVATSALSYAEEWAWSYVPDPAAELHDLPGVGLEQPGPDSF